MQRHAGSEASWRRIHKDGRKEAPPISEEATRGAASMAGHGGTTYKGYTIPHNKRWHTVAGKGLCAVMWFWVFYRAKQDGAVLLGLRHPWDGHDDHSHGHGPEHERRRVKLVEVGGGGEAACCNLLKVASEGCTCSAESQMQQQRQR
ncbi:hypothetical protein ABZP36_020913 [Zizania latifolia]